MPAVLSILTWMQWNTPDFSFVGHRDQRLADTNPKRKRGSDWRPSLALRVPYSLAKVSTPMDSLAVSARRAFAAHRKGLFENGCNAQHGPTWEDSDFEAKKR